MFIYFVNFPKSPKFGEWISHWKQTKWVRWEIEANCTAYWVVGLKWMLLWNDSVATCTGNEPDWIILTLVLLHDAYNFVSYASKNIDSFVGSARSEILHWVRKAADLHQAMHLLKCNFLLGQIASRWDRWKFSVLAGKKLPIALKEAGD